MHEKKVIKGQESNQNDGIRGTLELFVYILGGNKCRKYFVPITGVGELMLRDTAEVAK